MKTKLTLTIEEGVIIRAKTYAKETGRSLSELIESYLSKITNPNQISESGTVYGKDQIDSAQFVIPDWLRGIAGSVDADIDYVRDREKIREERYSKYLK
jgi:hypothetical protein